MKTVTKRLVYKNPAVPDAVYEREGFIDNFIDLVSQLHATDSPSSSDLRRIFTFYAEASPQERDAVDQSFVWFTGYSFASLAAQAELSRRGEEPMNYENTIKLWRRKKWQSSASARK